MATAAKTAPPGKITISVKPEHLAEIDQHRTGAIAGIPGARLSRTAWAEQAVERRLDELRQAPVAEPVLPGRTKAGKR